MKLNWQIQFQCYTNIIIKLAIDSGSNPDIANILGILLSSMISGMIYDIEKGIYKKGIDIMKKEILLVGLGICGDMV